MHVIKIEIDDQAKTDLAEYAMAQGMTLTEYCTRLVLAAAGTQHRAGVEAEAHSA